MKQRKDPQCDRHVEGDRRVREPSSGEDHDDVDCHVRYAEKGSYAHRFEHFRACRTEVPGWQTERNGPNEVQSELSSTNREEIDRAPPLEESQREP